MARGGYCCKGMLWLFMEQEPGFSPLDKVRGGVATQGTAGLTSARVLCSGHPLTAEALAVAPYQHL